MNNVQRVSRAFLLWLLILGGIWADCPVSALDQGLFIDNVVPGQVVPGQSFRIHGSFTGVTSASAYLSDGIWGLPLDVLEVTDQYIEA